MTQLIVNRPLRQIRSFVRREGPMTQRKITAWATHWPLYGLSIDWTNSYPKTLDLNKIFGRNAEKVVELGFGDGQSLFEMAKNAPEKDFLGIEVYKTGIIHLLDLVAAEKLTNVRVICADAKDVFEQCIEDASLATVQVFFADPWPKARHHKRRLVQSQFVSLVAKKLKPQGLFHLATDWKDYAYQMLKVISEDLHFHNVAPSASSSFVSRPPHRPITKYERRGVKLGHETWDLIFSRVGV